MLVTRVVDKSTGEVLHSIDFNLLPPFNQNDHIVLPNGSQWQVAYRDFDFTNSALTIINIYVRPL